MCKVMTDKVCFIILHYGDTQEITKKAIRSIKKLRFNGTVDIVVVCNGKQYDISSDISSDTETLVLEKNEGFSKGNNTGYAYAKEKDDYDFMIIINNDVFIEQPDFLPKLYKLYVEHPFYVGGPDVYVPIKDEHTSPMLKKIPTAAELEDDIQKMYKSLLQFEKSFSLKNFRSYISESYKYRDKMACYFRLKRKIKKNNLNYKGIQEDVVLQGSCLIFSRDYISINDKAFEPEVFLYAEEKYLSLRCKKNNWKIIYSEDLQVNHIDHGSRRITNLSYKDYCKKEAEYIKLWIAANEQLLSYIEANTEN